LVVNLFFTRILPNQTSFHQGKKRRFNFNPAHLHNADASKLKWKTNSAVQNNAKEFS